MKQVLPILGIICFIAFIVFAFKAFKNKPKRKKYVLYSIGAFILTGFLVGVSDENAVKKITISDININKNESKKISMSLEPKDAYNSDRIECSVKDKSIVSIKGNELKALKKGKTTYTCKIDDITSNKAIINVELTSKQIKEEKIAKEKKEKEEAAKKVKRLKEEAEKKKLKANTLSTSEKIRLKDYAKDLIDSVLKAPSTSKYPGSLLNPYDDWKMFKKNNLVTIASYVDAENSFGAKIRSNFVIQVKLKEDGSGTPTYVELDGRVLSGSYRE